MAQQRVWDVLVSGQCWWRSWWLWGNLWKVVRVWVLRGGGDLLGIITGRGQSRGRQDTISYQRRTATRPDPRILQQCGGHGRNGRFGGFSGFGGRLWWLWYHYCLPITRNGNQKKTEKAKICWLYIPVTTKVVLSWSDRIFSLLLLDSCFLWDLGYHGSQGSDILDLLDTPLWRWGDSIFGDDLPFTSSLAPRVLWRLFTTSPPIFGFSLS